MLPVFLRLSWMALFAGVFVLFLGVGRAEAETALASWYGPGFEGLPTATGEPYNPYGYTAAHKTMPLGTELLVSYEGNSVEVTVNDRGPYVGDRELDLSLGAAEALGLIEPGVDYVEYTYLGGGASYHQYTDAGGGVAYDQYGYTEYGYDTDASGYSEYGFDSAVATETVESPSYAEDMGYVQDAGYLQIVDYLADDGGGDGGIHVVSPGETLSGIADEMGTSVEYLAAYNGLTDPDFIFSGQVLYH